jgi:hypothetical protein
MHGEFRRWASIPDAWQPPTADEQLRESAGPPICTNSHAAPPVAARWNDPWIRASVCLELRVSLTQTAKTKGAPPCGSAPFVVQLDP